MRCVALVLTTLFTLPVFSTLHADPTASTVATWMPKLVGAATAGRRPGSDDHQRAQGLLIDTLHKLGFKPAGDKSAIGEISFVQSFKAVPTPHIITDAHHFAVEGANIIGVYHPEGQETVPPRVLLTAHYDHLGVDCMFPLPNRDGLMDHLDRPMCPGASDNAGGVAAVLAALPKLIAEAKAPFAVAFWDLEEYRLQGSKHFAANPTLDMKALWLLLNLDIIGLNLLPGAEPWTFIVGAETGGRELSLLFGVNGATDSYLKPRYLSYVFGHNRNDNTSFVAAGHKVPTVLITDGDGSYYHSNADTLHYFNMTKAEEISKVVEKAVLATLARKQGFDYASPLGWWSGQAMPNSADAEAVIRLAENCLKVAEAYLDSSEKEELQKGIEFLKSIRWRSWVGLLPADMKKVGKLVENVTKISRDLFRRKPDLWKHN